MILYAFFFKEPQEEDREWKPYSLRQALRGLEEELYAEETSRYAGSEASFSVIPKIFNRESSLSVIPECFNRESTEEGFFFFSGFYS